MPATSFDGFQGGLDTSIKVGGYLGYLSWLDEPPVFRGGGASISEPHYCASAFVPSLVGLPEAKHLAGHWVITGGFGVRRTTSDLSQ